MNDDVIFERAARGWLEVGPAVAPDRVVQAALDTIERTPQQRDLRTPWRFPRMTNQVRVLSVAAIGVIVIVAGAYMFRSPQGQVAGPGATPSVSPTATAAARTLDPTFGFLGKWVSVGERAIPGATGHALASIAFDATTLWINGFKGDAVSSWSMPADSVEIQLRIEDSESTLNNLHWNCSTGETGVYSIAITPVARLLTLTALEDPCLVRASILAGDWTAWPCPEGQSSTCGEAFEGGRRDTGAFAPVVFERPLYFDVPGGWLNSVEAPNTYRLERRSAPGSTITLYTDVAAHSQSQGCTDTPEPGVGDKSYEISDWLQQLPGIVVLSTDVVMVGDWAGLTIDVALDPASPGNCMDPGTDAAAFLFTNGVAGAYDQPDGPLPIRVTLEGTQRARYMIVNLTGEFRNMLVEVRAPDEASMLELLQPAMPIIQSLSSHPGS